MDGLSCFVFTSSVFFSSNWVLVSSYKEGSLLYEPSTDVKKILSTDGLPVPGPCDKGMFHWNSGCYPCSRYCYKGKCDKWTGVCNYHKCDDGSRYSEDFRCLRTCTKGWYGENCGRPCGKCLLDTCHPQHGLCYKGDKLGYSLRDEFFKAVDLNEPWNDSSLVRFHGWCEHMIEVKENKVTFANVSDRDFVVQGETKASSLDDIRSSAGFNYRGPRCEYRSGCDRGHYGIKCEEECSLCAADTSGPFCNDFAVCMGNSCYPKTARTWITKNIYGSLRCRQSECFPNETKYFLLPTHAKADEVKGRRCLNNCGRCFRGLCEQNRGACLSGCEDGYTGKRCVVQNYTYLNTLPDDEIVEEKNQTKIEHVDKPDMTPSEMIQSTIVVLVALMLPFVISALYARTINRNSCDSFCSEVQVHTITVLNILICQLVIIIIVILISGSIITVTFAVLKTCSLVAIHLGFFFLVFQIL